MRINYLISMFHDHLPISFIEDMHRYLKSSSLFVFIASNFEDHPSNEFYAKQVIQLFQKADIFFDKLVIIDYQNLDLKSIKEADFIWLSGGNTLKQMAYFYEIQLADLLKEYHGILAGMSAGAINMASRVVLAKDIEDNVPELSIYEGLGRVDINIEPHLDESRKDHLNDIYGLYDESYIKVIEDKMEVIGPHILYTQTKTLD